MKKTLAARILSILTKPAFYGIVYFAFIPIFAVLFWKIQGFKNETLSCWDSLYFSAVTITTLGYGDIQPLETSARILAATEAVLGILFIGLFLSALSHTRSEQQAEKEAQRNILFHEKLAQKNSELSKKIIDAIEGGDSYPIIFYQHINARARSTESILLRACIHVEGKNPLEIISGIEENHTQYSEALAESQGKGSYTQQEVDLLQSLRGNRPIPPVKLHPSDPLEIRDDQVIQGFVQIPAGSTEWQFSARIICRNGTFITSTRLKLQKIDKHSGFPNVSVQILASLVPVADLV